jgi:hypothetical protein
MVAMSNEPGVYVKGDSTRVASTPRDAVAALFDGFERAGDLPDAVEAEVGESDSVDDPTDVAQSNEPVAADPDPSPSDEQPAPSFF